jgi:hypothetical protein
VGGGIPSTSLRATTRQPGGRARSRRRRFRRGLPPGWRVVGLRQIDGMPHGPPARKIVGDLLATVRSLGGGRPTPKLLTTNQVLGERTNNGQSSRPKCTLAYINCYINGCGRPWTSLDLNPEMRPGPGQPAGSGGVLPATTDHMASEKL